MPRAEAGSLKHLANKMKSKGLQRLRWYCQVCERQMRDENGFKCHVASESHVRQMLVIGANPNKAINEFAKQFEHDFLQQLRTAHGTKSVQINHFYQEYIANKEHVHMNATKWHSLTDFAKHLGQNGICHVEETEKGIHISYIDRSPEAMRREEALRKRERQDKGDEEREQKLIREQIKRAQAIAKSEEETRTGELHRPEGEKIKLSFGLKPAASKLPTPPREPDEKAAANNVGTTELPAPETKPLTPPADESVPQSTTSEPVAAAPIKLSFGGASANKPKNVLAAKKNPLAAPKRAFVVETKKMSEAERIMKEEMERKRGREAGGVAAFSKRPRLG